MQHATAHNALPACDAALQIYIWNENYAENWSAFAPNFQELVENHEYVEAEDEFDEVRSASAWLCAQRARACVCVRLRSCVRAGARDLRTRRRAVPLAPCVPCVPTVLAGTGCTHSRTAQVKHEARAEQLADEEGFVDIMTVPPAPQCYYVYSYEYPVAPLQPAQRAL